MQAVVYSAFRTPPEVVDVAEPACPDDGVIIAVEATGLCRSDWHGWMGHDPDITVPHVPGHEFAGRIVAVGPAVRSWHVGDRVTTAFVGACGECASCRRGEAQVCDDQVQVGFHRWGSFAEHVAVPRAEHNVVGLPEQLSVDVAALLGCRFGTAYRAIVHHGRVAPDDWVVVHGCGGVGLSAVMIAAARGARVIAVDVGAAPLERAAQFGAEVLLRADEVEVPEAVREATGGGAQVSVDAFGAPATAEASIGCLGKRGRHVQVGLLAEDGGRVAVPMAAVLSNELELYGSHGLAARDYPQLIAEVGSGALDPARLIDRHVGLAEGALLLADGDSTNRPGATIIVPGGIGPNDR
jgi:alcohol dehydrogenase